MPATAAAAITTQIITIVMLLSPVAGAALDDVESLAVLSATASCIIAYVENTYGGAYRSLEYARKKKNAWKEKVQL